MSIDSLCEKDDDAGIRNFGRFALGAGLTYLSVDFWVSLSQDPDHNSVLRYLIGTALTAVAARFLVEPITYLIRSGEGLYINHGNLTKRPTLADRIFGKKVQIAGDTIPEGGYVLLEDVRITSTRRRPEPDYDAQVSMAAIPGGEPDNSPRTTFFTAEYRGQELSGAYTDYNPPRTGDSVMMVGRYKKGKISAKLIARS